MRKGKPLTTIERLPSSQGAPSFGKSPGIRVTARCAAGLDPLTDVEGVKLAGGEIRCGRSSDPYRPFDCHDLLRSIVVIDG